MTKKSILLVILGIIIVGYGIFLILSTNFQTNFNNDEEEYFLVIKIVKGTEIHSNGTLADSNQTYDLPIGVASNKPSFQNGGSYYFTIANEKIADMAENGILFGLYNKDELKSADEVVRLSIPLMDGIVENDPILLGQKNPLGFAALTKTGEDVITISGTFENIKLFGGEHGGIIMIPSSDESEKIKMIYIEETIFSMPTFEEELQLITNENLIKQIEEQRLNNTLIEGFSWILIGAIPLEIGSRFFTRNKQ